MKNQRWEVRCPEPGTFLVLDWLQYPSGLPFGKKFSDEAVDVYMYPAPRGFWCGEHKDCGSSLNTRPECKHVELVRETWGLK